MVEIIENVIKRKKSQRCWLVAIKEATNVDLEIIVKEEKGSRLI